MSAACIYRFKLQSMNNINGLTHTGNSLVNCGGTNKMACPNPEDIKQFALNLNVSLLGNTLCLHIIVFNLSYRASIYNGSISILQIFV